jgi:CRISPR-associated protein Csm1
VCGNPAITFSAGISFHKPQTPIDAMSREADEALEQSKERGRDRLSVFSETVEWKDMEALLSIRAILEEWLDLGWVSSALFYRFNEFIRMAAREQQVVRNKEVSIDDMSCTRWRALLVYTTERNVAKNIKGEERRKVVTDVTAKLTKWLEGYQGKLRIPLCEVAYNRRKA